MKREVKAATGAYHSKSLKYKLALNFLLEPSGHFFILKTQIH